MDLGNLRQNYEAAILHKRDLDKSPFVQFERWFEAAVAANLLEPNAMVLATATSEGKPSCRTVLLKHLDENGLASYTNYSSRKAKEIRENPHAAATFLWKELERQVIIEGSVVKTSREDSEKYFRQRPLRSQISAWASQQDAEIASRKVLEEAFKSAEKKFSGKEVNLPPQWGGFRLIPKRFEFWQGRRDRLHDRFQYVIEGSIWTISRLSP